MDDDFENLESTNNYLESKMNKFANISDQFAKENAFSDIQKMMTKFKNQVRLICYSF